jgi:putative Mn2+ efflux pump MntP
MAFALSMDNLVVGFSLGVQHISAAAAVAVFAAVTAFLSMLVPELGRRIGAAVESGAEYLAASCSWSSASSSPPDIPRLGL